jgi:uracil-DNA glycosylase
MAPRSAAIPKRPGSPRAPMLPMESNRRRQLLRALEIEAWVRPRAKSELELTSMALAAAPVVAAPLASPADAPQDTVMARPPKSKPAAAPQALLVNDAPEVAPYVAPRDWAGLAAAVAGCERCKLCRTRTNTVFGVGPQNAPLLVVGEGPGADEDAQGEPFVGRAGKLLDEMLKAIGRSRNDNTFIANVVKCRPPGNRDPEPDEVAACRPYLDRQIEILQPKLILALGRIAAQRLLATDEPLSKLRGPVFEYGSTKTPVLITYHPAYLLRSPGEKAKSWVDLKRVHRFLDANG